MELSALLRQFAYDRLLCRVFSAEPERWVLKGATAMLARLEGQAFAHNTSVAADELRRALRSEARRRQLTLPDHLEVPASSGWVGGYARVARGAPGLEERDLKSAVASARQFIDPPLAGTATGSWNPAAMTWIPRE